MQNAAVISAEMLTDSLHDAAVNSSHNSDLSDIREYIKSFLICGVRRIIENNATNFC